MPGGTHDKTAFDNAATIDVINKAKAGIGDKGYQGATLFTPTKKPRGRKLSTGERRQRRTFWSNGSVPIYLGGHVDYSGTLIEIEGDQFAISHYGTGTLVYRLAGPGRPE